MSKRKNYLNNRDILAEIHKSKCNHSVFSDELYKDYDIIVHSFDEIPESVHEAKINRAKKISQSNLVEAKQQDPVTKASDVEIDHSQITTEDIVFRVMTWDHIPDNLERKKTKKTIADSKEKVNFPPFQHWKYQNGDLVCVGKSHWTGELHNGEFTTMSGKATDKLALMWLKLIDRYSSRGNVRSYSYLDEMKNQAIIQLAHTGLQFDESKSNNPFAYYSQIITHSFVKIINMEKRQQDIRDDILEIKGFSPSNTRTTNHEWQSELRRNGESDVGYSVGNQK
mgnify:CR=1 FL=1